MVPMLFVGTWQKVSYHVENSDVRRADFYPRHAPPENGPQGCQVL